MFESVRSYLRSNWEYTKTRPWWYWVLLVAIVAIVPGWIIWGVAFILVTFWLFGPKKAKSNDSEPPAD